jgi:CheY-like chemotaxis protein
MIILIVDDMQERHDSAEKHLSPAHTLLHAYDASEAMEVIQGCQDKIGLALLDHDLGLGGMTGSGLATQWLQLDDAKFPARVIVISQNPDGALNIVSKFESANIHARHRPYDGRLMQDLAVQLRPE